MKQKLNKKRKKFCHAVPVIDCKVSHILYRGAIVYFTLTSYEAFSGENALNKMLHVNITGTLKRPEEKESHRLREDDYNYHNSTNSFSVV